MIFIYVVSCLIHFKETCVMLLAFNFKLHGPYEKTCHLFARFTFKTVVCWDFLGRNATFWRWLQRLVHFWPYLWNSSTCSCLLNKIVGLSMLSHLDVLLQRVFVDIKNLLDQVHIKFGLNPKFKMHWPKSTFSVIDLIYFFKLKLWLKSNPTTVGWGH